MKITISKFNTLASVGIFALASRIAQGHGGHHHSHSHNHSGAAGGVRKLGSGDGGNGHNHAHAHGHAHAHAHEPDSEEGPFIVADKFVWSSEKEFVENGGPCSTHEPEEEERKLIDAELAEHKRRNPDRHLANGVINIDVYFHVVYKSDGRGNVSDKMINDQITVLNDGFKGISTLYPNTCGFGRNPSGTSTPFNFVLKEITRTQNNAWYDNTQSNESSMKSSLRKGSCKDLNVYSTGADGYLGWATFPNGCGYNTNNDGVVVLSSSLPNGGQYKFDEGDTLTHEVGHWLGLYHTFQNSGGGGDACTGTGDFVEDTHSEKSAASGCPTTRNTCPGQGNDPVENFMDYSDDCCMFKFTPGQSERMVSNAVTYRNLNLVPTGPPAPSKAPTKAPTMAPTASPTPLECNSNEQRFDVTVRTDLFGSETAWRLEDSTGNEVMSVPGATYGNNEVNTDSTCLVNGVYTFTIEDAYADGICCSWGEGYYELTLDGAQLKRGGSFGSSEKTIFTVDSSGTGGGGNPSPSTKSPTNAPTNAPTKKPTAPATIATCDEVCVEEISVSECPADPNLPNCKEVPVGELCEGDGECETDPNLNNCSGGWDVYRRVSCTGSGGTEVAPTKAPTKSPTNAPTNAPTKIPTKAPTNAPTKKPTAPATIATCDEVCVEEISVSECPANPDLPNCKEVPVGELCEGDGECETNQNLNNCSPGFDVYRRVSCTGSGNTEQQSPTKAPTEAPTNAPTKKPTGSQASCENSSSWRFVNNKGDELTCNWVAKKKNRRCKKVGKDGTDGFESCPVACNTC